MSMCTDGLKSLLLSTLLSIEGFSLSVVFIIGFSIFSLNLGLGLSLIDLVLLSDSSPFFKSASQRVSYIIAIFFAAFAMAFLSYQVYKGTAILAGGLHNMGISALSTLGHLGASNISILLTPTPILVIAAIVLSVSVFSIYSAMNRSKDSFIGLLKSYFAFLMFYSLLYATFWFFVFNAKLFGKEFRFGGVIWKNSIINRVRSAGMQS